MLKDIKYYDMLRNNLLSEIQAYIESPKITSYNIHLNQLSQRSKWLEYDSYIKILPRQFGKSSLIMYLKKELTSKKERVEIVALPQMQQFYEKEGIIAEVTTTSYLEDRADFDKKIMLVDEFCFVDQDMMDYVLSKPWKKLVMLSTHNGVFNVVERT